MTAPDLSLATRTGLPDDLRVLLDRWPRARWDGALGETGRFWLARHAMFRETQALLSAETRAVAEGRADPLGFRPRFRRLAGFLLQELKTHHHVEDHHYFPRLVALDPRLARGFDLLDADHQALHATLEATAERANALLQALTGPQAREAAARMVEASDALRRLLDRHLADEEEIVAPLLLQHGEEGIR